MFFPIKLIESSSPEFSNIIIISAVIKDTIESVTERIRNNHRRIGTNNANNLKGSFSGIDPNN
jgi:hypothetical protein